MRLQDMSVLEKADKLEELLNKADLDVDYAITVHGKIMLKKIKQQQE